MLSAIVSSPLSDLSVTAMTLSGAPATGVAGDVKNVTSGESSQLGATVTADSRGTTPMDASRPSLNFPGSRLFESTPSEAEGTVSDAREQAVEKTIPTKITRHVADSLTVAE